MAFGKNRGARRGRGKGAVLLVAGMVGAAALFAEQPGSFDDELRQIFEKRAYTLTPFGPARWLDGGRAYTTLEPSPEAKDPHEAKDAMNARGAKTPKDIVAYDTASGRREVLVPSSRLVPAGGSAPLTIEDYDWSSDRSRLLVFTNSKKVWRTNTRGDYWVLDLPAGRLRQLGKDAPASSLMFAKLSPDGTRAAYVRGNNLYVENLSTGAVTPLTADGSETTINGTTDWVTEEEFRLRQAFRWSPDSRRIAYWQFDTTKVGLFTLIDDTDALYPVVKRYPYPKVGTTNSAVRVGVVAAAGGPTRWIAVPGDPRDSYIPRMEWADSGALVLEHVNRLQNVNDLLVAEVSGDGVKTVVHEESRSWVDINDQIRTLDGGRAVLWESERDGWRHVYRVARGGGPPLLVTRFEGDVIQVEGVDEPGGFLYFLASPGNATQRYLYRSLLNGTGGVERVTPAGRDGSHSYDLSPDRRWAFHTSSRFDEPPTTDLVRLPGHSSERVLADNGALRSKAAALLERPVEFFQVSIGEGVVLDGWMIRPRQFDPGRKYPLLVFVYGEPASQTVLDRWPGNNGLFHRALANEGYIVASFDNRGTPAPKGAAWRKIAYGSVGAVSSKDQAAAVRAFAAGRPYVDPARVAIWGWSGGGSSTLNAMFRFPDVYKVGVAVASVPDQRLYDTIYQERYMGLPDQNAEGYRAGSPITFAEGLKGKLLIVHGSGDDNVHYQGAEKLVNRLVELGKPFDMMVYPNRTHSISEGSGTSLHVYTAIARYIREQLPPGGK
jgi:dipeptidyl-peptidase 4